jgi:glycosyltransferase involved in cell wall biosynthesis
MKIAILTHPTFLSSQSMPRFARMLQEAYEARGHSVSLHTAPPRLYRVITHPKLAKWAGYIDQYLLYPRQLKREMRQMPADTLFVFCDQALGPWCPIVKDRPHVVHAHDLLALRSALGDIPENPTSSTGKVYQRFIRQGFQKATRFIAISKRTKADLIAFADIPAEQIEVVYNGLNQHFTPTPPEQAARTLQAAGLPHAPLGFLMHLGGSQWYKNTAGICLAYAEYVKRCDARGQAALPLLMISPKPEGAALKAALSSVPPSGQVMFKQGINHEILSAAYSQCAAFLFPSLAEGFGWPIVEAQACGAQVITTDDAPMNEVGGPAAHYLPRLAYGAPTAPWATQAADMIDAVVNMPMNERAERAQSGIEWARGFQGDIAIEGYLEVYKDVLNAAPSRL